MNDLMYKIKHSKASVQNTVPASAPVVLGHTVKHDHLTNGEQIVQRPVKGM